GVIAHCMEALRSGGRLAVAAVTLETESLLASLHGAHGGQLLRVEISRAEPLGNMTGWRPARPVAIWSWTKS
ncbi:MAG TPA: cobalamin biosynthesis bifunctional protein CbiET, partial [Rhizorhapis sp.]|nr:cobalamin biosynthesis bifunctional protein CbiET [Rhizorhapis sp.]